MDKLRARALWEKSKEFREMIILTCLENKPMTNYELSVFLINRSYLVVVNRPLKKLEKKGYIIRRDEGTKNPYEITQKGKGALSQYRNMLNEFLNYVNPII